MPGVGGVHEGGATVDDVAQLEKILKRAIILRDIAGETYTTVGNTHWPKDLHFPQSREVHIYEGDVWQAFREATRGEPLAVWWDAKTDSSQSTNLCSRTAAPTGHKGPMRGS
ncbi:MAG: hypothetical protein AB2556_24955 [Candidatus Thiodiazotropha sp.]